MIFRADTPLVATDCELQSRVTTSLVLHHIPGVRWLDIQACNGTVTLRGRVRSFHQKQRCIHCCRHVAGVYELIDRLEVVDLAHSSPGIS